HRWNPPELLSAVDVVRLTVAFRAADELLQRHRRFRQLTIFGTEQGSVAERFLARRNNRAGQDGRVRRLPARPLPDEDVSWDRGRFGVNGPEMIVEDGSHVFARKRGHRTARRPLAAEGQPVAKVELTVVSAEDVDHVPTG